MEEKKLTTGERIENLRKQKGMKQIDLSNASGINRTAISRYEAGILTKISAVEMVKLAKALDTTEAYLLGETEEEGNPWHKDDGYVVRTKYRIPENKKRLMEKFGDLVWWLDDDETKALEKALDAYMEAKGMKI